MEVSCWQRVNFLLKEFLFSREMCLQQCGTEDARQETRPKETIIIVRRIERQGRTSPTEQWWVNETLVKYCENAWLDMKEWDEHMKEWEEWLGEEGKKEKRQQLKESHETLVEKFMSSGKGRAGFLHKVTKPTLRRGCIQILEEVYDDADHLKRLEEKRQESSKHWQISTEAQKLEDKQWKNIQLWEKDEVLPPKR